MILKQNTVYARKFLMVQDATGANPHIGGKTGLASITVYLNKGVSTGGGTGSAAASNSGTVVSPGLVEVDSANLPGVYQISFSTTDVNTLGDLAVHCTATGADPTDFIDQVQLNVFSDLLITGNLGAGRVNVTTNLQQNQPFTALFFMTQTGTNNPAPGLTVTGQRTFGAAGFSNIAGTIAEVGGAGAGGGWYVLNGAAADSNAPCVGFKMTSIGANDTDFTLWTQP